jgi:ComF family protein
MALDILLPPRCILCGQASGSICICEPCKADLPWIASHCRQCGLPLESKKDEICGNCIQNSPTFTRTVCPLRYEFPVDRLVQLFKFNRQLAAGRVLSHLMSQYATNQNLAYPDALIPVPLHSFRMIKRGFNQAYELGSYISKVLDIPLVTTSLRRHRNTRAQSGLSRKQRRKNLRGAFYWHGSNRPGRHLALIDDVMTTGTTVSECARVLKKAGAKRVDVWVAARAIPASRQ